MPRCEAPRRSRSGGHHSAGPAGTDEGTRHGETGLDRPVEAPGDALEFQIGNVRLRRRSEQGKCEATVKSTEPLQVIFCFEPPAGWNPQ